MPQKQEQGPCFLVMGIVLGAVGFLWWWPLMFLGGFFFIMGICIIIQEANKPKTQTTAQPTAEPVAQPAPQPVSQPISQPEPRSVPVQMPEYHKFCPHCGAPATGRFCSDCGTEID
ncbi:MAG: hypothetical protein ACFFAH_00575 [Promethearchaeota archaeon]